METDLGNTGLARQLLEEGLEAHPNSAALLVVYSKLQRLEGRWAGVGAGEGGRGWGWRKGLGREEGGEGQCSHGFCGLSAGGKGGGGAAAGCKFQ